jgi:hypothetical protein
MGKNGDTTSFIIFETTDYHHKAMKYYNLTLTSSSRDLTARKPSANTFRDRKRQHHGVGFFVQEAGKAGVDRIPVPSNWEQRVLAATITATIRKGRRRTL